MWSYRIKINRTIKLLKEACEHYERVVCTSSFQTQSLVLLHIISQNNLEIPIYFLDTGYHFPETIEFKNIIADLFSLKVIDIKPSISQSLQIDELGRPLYMTDPDLCCYYNKVLPMTSVLQNCDLWISGVRHDQTTNRRQMKEKEKGPYNTIRLHPLLEWSQKDVENYISKHNLPRHPLEQNSLRSIGCMPCTKFENEGKDNLRIDRWNYCGKTECGLHTILRGEKLETPVGVHVEER